MVIEVDQAPVARTNDFRKAGNFVRPELRQRVATEEGLDLAVGIKQVAMLIGAVKRTRPQRSQQAKRVIRLLGTAAQPCDLSLEHQVKVVNGRFLRIQLKQVITME